MNRKRFRTTIAKSGGNMSAFFRNCEHFDFWTQAQKIASTLFLCQLKRAGSNSTGHDKHNEKRMCMWNTSAFPSSDMELQHNLILSNLCCFVRCLNRSNSFLAGKTLRWSFVLSPDRAANNCLGGIYNATIADCCTLQAFVHVIVPHEIGLFAIQWWA